MWPGVKVNEVATAAEDRDHWILHATNPSYEGRH